MSRDLGAVPDAVGAQIDNISAWYSSHGLSCTKAYNGLLESAAAEASKALDRGCDVNRVYLSNDGTQGHIEVVNSMAPDPENPNAWRCATLSWGKPAVVTVEAGRFRGKTDGPSTYNQVSPAGVTESFLSTTGQAIFYYYCKM